MTAKQERVSDKTIQIIIDGEQVPHSLFLIAKELQAYRAVMLKVREALEAIQKVKSANTRNEGELKARLNVVKVTAHKASKLLNATFGETEGE